MKKKEINIDKGWVSTGELALILNVPFSTIRSWIANDKLALVRRPNGRIAIPIAEVLRIQDEQKDFTSKLEQVAKQVENK